MLLNSTIDEQVLITYDKYCVTICKKNNINTRRRATILSTMKRGTVYQIYISLLSSPVYCGPIQIVPVKYTVN